mmetsp:Transcript_12182/g.24947  ORF Transcript_12182/g.24947 Transcript_12182/m.24947 type:complete len:769 (-) Transcript_12182:86-2392(-)|eukprot:CAMPEP_0118645606 /NCGR_PEP_ID=MMETSP0785-20121206/7596_1 /TAXON_ID=91992 /ORGANISM="Bolidomonas pacifica, Strain CCMP 1866" /LENGTH=768 /DNA_ID=CAMNT_0006537511 /DNA_START=115 /DNA_END=2421 /DNA_ORIENTATION=-
MPIIRFKVSAPSVDSSKSKPTAYFHTVHVIGSVPELGLWNEELSVQLSKTGSDIYEGQVEVDEDNAADEVRYKYLVKRNDVLVRWETIPPPFRTYTAGEGEREMDILGVLPKDHPKRVRGTTKWIDRKLCTETGGSEFRLTVGTDKFKDNVSIRESTRPGAVGLRLRWGKGEEEPLKCFSKSGGNIQSRRCDFITDEKEEEKREKEHREKLVTHSSTSCSIFKFNADYEKLLSETQYGENWLELDVINLDTSLVVGTSHISLANFKDPSKTQGSFRSSVFSNYKTPEMEPVGDVYVEFLIVHPFVSKVDGAPRFQHCYRQYWTGIGNSNRKTLDIGHRGLGRSYRNVPEQASVRENTLLSFSEAGKLGAEYVELDVMLTKDRVPVVFHDFDIGIKGDAKKFESNLRGGGAGGRQSLAVQISELTLAQLKALKTTGTDSEDFASHGQSIKSFKSGLDLFEAGMKGGGDKEELVSVPTLEQLLTSLPQWLGLNIEIKYPVELHHEWLNKQPQYELNSYVDDILGPLFSHCSGRRIVFSCFHPNVCIALMLKQPRFPVCFLTGEHESHFRDRRCCTLSSAVSFAESEYLLGIVTNSEVLFRDKDNKHTDVEDDMVGEKCVGHLRSKGLVMWTWGDLNTFPGWVELQRRWGVDAVICDSVHKLVRKGKHRSIFQDDLGKSIDKHMESLGAEEVEVELLRRDVKDLGEEDEGDVGLSLSPMVGPTGTNGAANDTASDREIGMSPLALAATAVGTSLLAGGVAAMSRSMSSKNL